MLADAAGSAQVASGGCDGSSTPAPLGPLVEMLPSLPADVWPREATRHEVFTRLVAALTPRGSERPYLLVVEDAHWADEATLDLIRHLARRIHQCRALVLVTYRPEDLLVGHPLRVVLGDVATAPGVRRLDLPGLSRAAVQVLAADYAEGHPDAAAADVARLHQVTGGNAFFVTEVLSAGTGDVPATVRDAVQARVARLSAPARAALDVVALCGARAEVTLLDAVVDGGLEVLDEPVQRGLLNVGAGEVTFRHELARLAVADPIPSFRRFAIHRRILGALLDRMAGGAVDPARVAHHADAAGVADAVLAHAPDAATRAAELGAHREAVRQYQRTLRFADRLEDGHRANLLWALGYECYLTDQVPDAVAAVQAALEIWQAADDRVRVGDAYRCLSRLNWFAGCNEVAERQAVQAVDVLQGSDTVELAMAYSNIAQLRMLSSDTDGTRLWAGRALATLETLPEGPKRDEVAVHALNNLGTAETVSGDRDAGIRMLTSSLERSRAADLHEHAARAYCNLVSCAVLQRRHADAERLLDAGLEYCIDRDLDAWTLYLRGWQAHLTLNRGEISAARRRAESVLLRTEAAPSSQVEPLVVVALAAARAGDPAWVEPMARAARLAEGPGEIQRLGPVVAAQSEIAWLTGDHDTPGSARRADLAEGDRRRLPPGTGGRSPPGWRNRRLRTALRSLRRTRSRCRGRGSRPPPAGSTWAPRTTTRWPWPAAPTGRRWPRRCSASTPWGASGAAARTRALMRARGWSVPRAPRGERQRASGRADPA